MSLLLLLFEILIKWYWCYYCTWVIWCPGWGTDLVLIMPPVLSWFPGISPKWCFRETAYGSSAPNRLQAIFLWEFWAYLGYQKCHKIWRCFSFLICLGTTVLPQADANVAWHLCWDSYIWLRGGLTCNNQVNRGVYPVSL